MRGHKNPTVYKEVEVIDIATNVHTFYDSICYASRGTLYIKKYGTHEIFKFHLPNVIGYRTKRYAIVPVTLPHPYQKSINRLNNIRGWLESRFERHTQFGPTFSEKVLGGRYIPKQRPAGLMFTSKDWYDLMSALNLLGSFTED